MRGPEKTITNNKSSSPKKREVLLANAKGTVGWESSRNNDREEGLPG